MFFFSFVATVFLMASLIKYTSLQYMMLKIIIVYNINDNNINNKIN